MNSVNQVAIKEYFENYKVRIYISNLEKHLNINKLCDGYYILLEKCFTCFKDSEEITFLINVSLDLKDRSKPIVEMKGVISDELKKLCKNFKCKLNNKIFLRVLSNITISSNEPEENKKTLIILFKIIDNSNIPIIDKTLPFSINF